MSPAGIFYCRPSGHSEIDTSQNIYGKSWWEERVDAVSAAVDLLMTSTEPRDGAENEKVEDNRMMLFASDSEQLQLEPQVEPQHQ